MSHGVTIYGGYIDQYNPLKDKKNEKAFSDRMAIVLGIIQAFGTFVSVGTLMVIGIKMMVASVEEKSLLKQALPGYVLGAIMVFAMTWLPKLIYKAANKLN